MHDALHHRRGRLVQVAWLTIALVGAMFVGHVPSAQANKDRFEPNPWPAASYRLTLKGTAQSPETTTMTSQLAGPFPDVPASHPYAAQIRNLAARAVINGYVNGNFGPEDPVTRQQFAKMIVLAKGFPVSESDICPFGDVYRDPGSFYPDNYVAVAAMQGITTGYADGNYRPGANISRAQVITMVTRAANLAGLPPASYVPPFPNFSPDHYTWARVASWAGLLEGLQGVGESYDFWRSATRGEVCALLDNLSNVGAAGTLAARTKTTLP